MKNLRDKSIDIYFFILNLFVQKKKLNEKDEKIPFLRNYRISLCKKKKIIFLDPDTYNNLPLHYFILVFDLKKFYINLTNS